MWRLINKDCQMEWIGDIYMHLVNSNKQEYHICVYRFEDRYALSGFRCK